MRIPPWTSRRIRNRRIRCLSIPNWSIWKRVFLTEEFKGPKYKTRGEIGEIFSNFDIRVTKADPLYISAYIQANTKVKKQAN